MDPQPALPTTRPSESTEFRHRRRRTKRRRLTRFFLAGLATLLPTLLTAYIIYICYEFVHSNLGRWLAYPLARVLGLWDPEKREITEGIVWFAGDVLAVVIVVFVAFSVGALAGSWLGRRIVRGGERFLMHLPFVKIIFPYVKQVTDFIFSDKRTRFRTVVAVAYPRLGLYSLGFVTGGGMRSVSQATGEDSVQVFIPSSPTPITGYVIFVPRSDLIELPMTVDEALRFAISAGVIIPPHEVRALPAVAEDDEEFDEEDDQGPPQD